MFGQLAYVREQLAKYGRQEWFACEKVTRVPFSTIKRIAYKQTKNPGSVTIDKIAAYFRTKERRAA